MNIDDAISDYMRNRYGLNDVARTNREIGFRAGYEAGYTAREHDELSPLDIAVALAWFQHNTEPEDVADLIGAIRFPLSIAARHPVLALPVGLARKYVDAAIERYGAEAKRRNEGSPEV